MELNKKSLRELTELSDEELREKINAAAESAGIDRSRTSAYLHDMAGIKKKLNSLSDTQIKALLNALGEDNVRKIKEGLDNGPKR